MDVCPEILITVSDIDPGASWVLTATDGGNEMTMIPEKNNTGVYRASLKDITGWSGVKTITFKIYVNGEGKSVWIDRMGSAKDNVLFQKQVVDLLGDEYKVVSLEESVAAAQLFLQQNAGWRDDFTGNNWTSETATLTASSGVSTIRDNSGGYPFGSVKSPDISLNVDTNARIFIKTNSVESGGKWFVCVNDGGNDIQISPSETYSGIYVYDLKKKTGWSGNKTFNIRLYEDGEQKAFNVDWIEIK